MEFDRSLTSCDSWPQNGYKIVLCLPWPGPSVSRNWCALFWICKTAPLLWEQQGKPHSFQVFETRSPVPVHGQAFFSKKEQVQWSSLLRHILQNLNLSSTPYFRYFCLTPLPIPAYLGSGLQRFRVRVTAAFLCDAPWEACSPLAITAAQLSQAA